MHLIELAEIVDDNGKNTGKYSYCIVGCKAEYDFKKTLKENYAHYDLWHIDDELHDCIREYYDEKGEEAAIKICEKEFGCDSEGDN